MLFFVEYGCTCENVKEIVEMDDLEMAAEYAYQNAIASYESYEGLHGMLDQNDVAMDLFGKELEECTEEECEDVYMEYRAILEDDIFYDAELYNEENSLHKEIFEEGRDW